MAIRSTHKGDRAQLGPRVDRVVYNLVVANSNAYGEHGISRGQWVADLLAALVGHPELMRELSGEDVARILADALENPQLLATPGRRLEEGLPLAI